MDSDAPPMESAAREIRVHFLPELAHPHEVAGNDLVVVDVLRASTTIVAALEAGAAQVLPCLEVAEARSLAAEREKMGLAVALGGERQGKPIKGFDFGNSPREYVSERVVGRTIVFTTTNGTRAMMRCIGAGRVLIGAFANLSAVVSELVGTAGADILCAGTDGEPSMEDILFAGALVNRLQAADPELSTNDSGRLAIAAWRKSVADNDLPNTLRSGQGGVNLMALGLDADIDFAAEIDRFRGVPVLDLADWLIRLASESS